MEMNEYGFHGQSFWPKFLTKVVVPGWPKLFASPSYGHRNIWRSRWPSKRAKKKKEKEVITME